MRHSYFLQVERSTWDSWGVIVQATVLMNHIPAPFEKIVRLVENKEWIIFGCALDELPPIEN